MAVWALATSLFLAQRAMRVVPFVRVLGGTALLVVGTLFLSGRLQPVVQMASVVSSDTWSRLRLGQEVAAYSEEPRFGDAILAWNMFLDRPLAGHGVGASVEWDRFESTHDIYLRHLV